MNSVVLDSALPRGLGKRIEDAADLHAATFLCARTNASTAGAT